jgi:hypothetical protein
VTPTSFKNRHDEPVAEPERGSRGDQDDERERRQRGEAARQDRTDPLRRPAIAHAHSPAGGVAKELDFVSLQCRERLCVELKRLISRRIEAVHHDDKICVDLRVVLRRQGFGDLFHRLVRIDGR